MSNNNYFTPEECKSLYLALAQTKGQDAAGWRCESDAFKDYRLITCHLSAVSSNFIHQMEEVIKSQGLEAKWEIRAIKKSIFRIIRCRY